MCGKDLELNVVMCRSLIIGLCKSGNIWHTVKIMEDMETTRLRPDSTLLCDSSFNFQQDSSLATSNQWTWVALSHSIYGVLLLAMYNGALWGKNVSRQSLAAITVELTVSFPLVRRASANVVSIIAKKLLTPSYVGILYRELSIVLLMAHGMPLFQYSSVDPRFNQVFISTMFHATSLMMNKIFIGKYKGFENMKEVTDIGGGIGTGT
ncbi:hypothetical protein IFM89_001464 [Coptis chinensis]|uniref:O-methyltransferase C-terminal domain-containing protein n=1 Tax=Coptis chinensis TaxID=261450 RepID=A0A835LD37_9MAGN|nr:hypothetical protein IFM89_001464 [Coptis chinensis]